MKTDNENMSEYAKGYVRGYSQALTLLKHLSTKKISVEDALAHCYSLLDEDILPWAKGQKKNRLDPLT